MTVEVPELPDECWPVAIPAEHASDWAALEAEVRNVAVARASALLRTLTGYRVGGCPVTVRPCRAGCEESTWATYPVSGSGRMGWRPALHSGVWLNVGCGHGSSCGCSGARSVTLVGPVGEVVAVRVDGATLDPAAYEVRGLELVRLDGYDWPLTQDLSLADTQPGTWSVTYLPAEAVDGLGARAAGLLAWEYVKEAGGGVCRVPANVTRLARQGTTLDLDAESTGTGIEEVDQYVARWNPHRLRSRPRVYSPDVVRPRG